MALRIKEVIKEKGMTVQTLADKMGINRVGLSNHINGNPSVAVLEKISTALEVPIQELFEKEKNENINGYIFRTIWGIFLVDVCGKNVRA